MKRSGVRIPSGPQTENAPPRGGRSPFVVAAPAGARGALRCAGAERATPPHPSGARRSRAFRGRRSRFWRSYAPAPAPHRRGEARRAPSAVWSGTACAQLLRMRVAPAGASGRRPAAPVLEELRTGRPGRSRPPDRLHRRVGDPQRPVCRLVGLGACATPPHARGTRRNGPVGGRRSRFWRSSAPAGGEPRGAAARTGAGTRSNPSAAWSGSARAEFLHMRVVRAGTAGRWPAKPVLRELRTGRRRAARRGRPHWRGEDPKRPVCRLVGLGACGTPPHTHGTRRNGPLGGLRRRFWRSCVRAGRPHRHGGPAAPRLPPGPAPRVRNSSTCAWDAPERAAGRPAKPVLEELRTGGTPQPPDTTKEALPCGERFSHVRAQRPGLEA